MIDKSTKYDKFISFFKEKFKKGDNVIVSRIDMEKNFPELKTEPTEEDENNIRNSIIFAIQHIEAHGYERINNVEISDIYDWLNKKPSIMNYNTRRNGSKKPKRKNSC